jgi:eukaryotic-like serine/threonine-protein kinase
MTGTTVGHYEIQDKLGEGGMGVVYRARDVLLNRSAALKFLPTDGADPEEKRRRFVQEAQSASALNHPNIITIYEVAQAGDRDFIAMELVQGQPLDKLIEKKPLALSTALSYAIQIADALAAAHAAGIVHRDLKPGNVMVGDSGRIKVLDFGLAKLMASSSSSDASQTVLAGSPRTVQGTIMGTVAYMAPEQAEGKAVDHRSDIFSFGALVYEMLTARRAFRGDSTVSTLAAILTTEPTPLSTEIAGLPTELVRIVSRCLRKPPEKRWQSIADVRIALEELKQDLEAGRTDAPAAAVSARRRLWIPIAATALGALALGGVIAYRARPLPPTPDLWRIVRLTADAGASLFPAISRDGKLVTYVSDRAAPDSMDLWVQQIDTGDPVQLTKGLGACRDPAFSPDASKIVLHCGAEPGGIYVVPTFGGLPKLLAEGELPQFSPDGSQISYQASRSGTNTVPAIWIIPASGGAGKSLKVGESVRDIGGAPIWNPDGKGLLFIGFGNQANGVNESDWYHLSINTGVVAPTGARQRLEAAGLDLGRNLTLTPGGVLFANGNIDSTNIYRMPLDATFQKVTADPIPLIVGAGFNFSPTASQDGGRITFAVGNNMTTNVWRVPIDAKTGQGSGAPVRVTNGLDPSLTPSPSRDGKRVAYLGGSRRSPEIHIRELDTGADHRLVDAKDWSYVVLSPDGSTVAYSGDLRVGSAVYSVAASGGVPKKICASCGRPVEWLPDRTKLLIDNAGSQHKEIQVLDVASGQTKPLLKHSEFQLTMPRLSPDGRFLAFSMVRTGRARRIYVVPFTGEPVPEKDWTLLLDGSDLDRQPFWTASGNTIYFMSDRDGARCIWGQRVDPTTGRPVGAPVAVHHMHQFRFNLDDLDPASVGLSVANGQLIYAAFEFQSNVWLAERREQPAR